MRLRGFKILLVLLVSFGVFSGCSSKKLSYKENNRVDFKVNGNITWSHKDKLYKVPLPLVKIDNLLWYDLSSNNVRVTKTKAKEMCIDYFRKAQHGLFSGFRLPTKSELNTLNYSKKGKKLLQNISPNMYWSTVTESKKSKSWTEKMYSVSRAMNDFSKGVKSGYSGVKETKYLRCVRNGALFDDHSVFKLVDIILKKQNKTSVSNQTYLNLTKNSMSMKWGNPIIKNMQYDSRKQLFNVQIVPSKEVNPKVMLNATVPVKSIYANDFKEYVMNSKPKLTVNMKVDNNQFSITNIKEFKNPEQIVFKSGFEKAFDSKERLQQYIEKYPNTTYLIKAEDRIKEINTYKNSLNSISQLRNFISLYPSSSFIVGAKEKLAILQQQESMRVEKTKQIQEKRDIKKNYEKIKKLYEQGVNPYLILGKLKYMNNKGLLSQIHIIKARFMARVKFVKETARLENPKSKFNRFHAGMWGFILGGDEKSSQAILGTVYKGELVFLSNRSRKAVYPIDNPKVLLNRIFYDRGLNNEDDVTSYEIVGNRDYLNLSDYGKLNKIPKITNAMRISGETKPISNYLMAIGNIGATVMAELCRSGACDNLGNSSSSSTNSSTKRDTSSNINTTTNRVTGYKIIEEFDYSARQTVIAVIKCNSNGRKAKVRYYPNNGSKYAIDSGFGDSVDDVASEFCSNF